MRTLDGAQATALPADALPADTLPADDGAGDGLPPNAQVAPGAGAARDAAASGARVFDAL